MYALSILRYCSEKLSGGRSFISLIIDMLSSPHQTAANHLHFVRVIFAQRTSTGR